MLEYINHSISFQRYSKNILLYSMHHTHLNLILLKIALIFGNNLLKKIVPQILLN